MSQTAGFKGIKGIILIVRKSLAQHALSTLISVLSLALGSGLVMAVFSINQQTYSVFTGGQQGFDGVLGPRGSELQLVLNSVYHLETSPGNIPWSLYQNIKKDKRVRLAIPYAVGDNYRGYRIVGTVRELFTQHRYRKKPVFKLKSGRLFKDSGREVILGSYVSEKTGLKAGSTFRPSHGLTKSHDEHHEDDHDDHKAHSEIHTVVGVLEPTNSQSDKVIWSNIDSFYRMGGHVLRGSGSVYTPKEGVAIPDAHKEVSAVMLKLKSPQFGFFLKQRIRQKEESATFAWPIGTVMAGFINKIGWVTKVLTLISYLIVLVAVASMLAVIYNSIQERKRHFAIFRSLGARKSGIFSMIIVESMTISALGAIAGFAVYMAVFSMASGIIRSQTGVALDMFGYSTALWVIPAGMIAIGALVGVVPAVRAYSTDVASNLAPQS
ncbi:MAG: ABC transporter permease [Spirochaetota bacterium]|nr:ABC transporter permease [Spirochaetota bacterium]